MKFNTQSPLVVLCLFFIIISFFSCSKDSDLMADYVALDPEVLIGKYVRSDTFQISIISNSEDDTFDITVNSGSGGASSGTSAGTTVNDTYETSSSASIVLDVLANDTFSNKEEVVISEISQPLGGDVVINSDNTLTYTPFTLEATEDTFTYTAEFVKEDGAVGKETGNVTVTINEGSDKLGELKAFPTAEGFGRYATGGRGGRVIHVTNLNDNGVGSLREALEASGPRYVVFDVGGTINLTNLIVVKGDLTIAGETAPGGGILIKGGELRISNTDNVIMRYLRIRGGTGRSGQSSNLDNLRVISYVDGDLTEDIIIDHCSFSWPVDESVYFRDSNNCTMQYCFFTHAGKNMIIQLTRNYSFLNNFTAFCRERNILSNTSNHLDFTFEEHNNIVYGEVWGSGSTEGQRFNVTHNKFETSVDQQPNPSSPWVLYDANPENNDTGDISTTKAYINNNTFASPYTREYDSKFEPYMVTTPYHSSGYEPTPVSELETKLLSHVGASVPARDQIDSDALSNYYARTGVMITGPYPTIATGTPYTDADNDDMWDVAEIAVFGNITTTNNPNGDHDGDGYEDIEETFFYFTGE